MISSVGMSREMNRIIFSLANRVNNNSKSGTDLQGSNVFSIVNSSFADKPRLGNITKDNYPGTWDLLDINFEEELNFEYSKAKTNPSDLEINWSIPTCMGPHLLGSPFDEHFQKYFKEYPEEYAKLMEKRAERCEAVSEKYGLEGLSNEELYYKTQGELSKEMTDFFYNGFDEEGKRLIAFFFPKLAEEFGF